MAVFPLPPVGGVAAATLSKTAFQYTSDAIDAFNWLQGVGFRPEANGGRGAQAKEDNLQAEALEALSEAAVRWSHAGEPPAPAEAWNSMMKGRGGYSMAAATAHSSMASFSSGRLSVPKTVVDSPMLRSLLPPSESERLKGYRSKMLRDPAEVTRLADELGAPGRHWDPKFSCRRTYLRFISQLHDIGLVRFVKVCKEEIGCFFVWKKGRQQIR